MSENLTKRRKRGFLKARLTDDHYKSWLRKVPSDNSLYHCTICNTNFSCYSTHISRHANCPSRRKKSEKSLKCNDKNANSIQTLRLFQPKWLEIEDYKCWLREVPNNANSFFCLICGITMNIGNGLPQIERHAESKRHVDKCKNNIQLSNLDEQPNTQLNEPLMSFDDRRKEAEIKYAALIATKNISHNIAKDILDFFQQLADDPNVLKSMTMGRTKCTSTITNVLYPVETERVVNNIQNTKFSIFIDETSDITNDKWMTFLVRYIDAETLNNRVQLVKLIDLDAKDCSADKLFNALKCEMWKLKIPFQNILALSCDNASVMTGKQKSFKKKLEEVCPNLMTFSCPCHSAALAAQAACKKIPDFCVEFVRKIVKFVNSSPKRSAIYREFCMSFEEKYLKLKKLCETRWLSHYQCVERLLQYWNTIELFLNEQVISEKSKSAEELLLIMGQADTKAYFLFLKYILNEFNAFNAFFQAIDTRINLLQPKSVNFLFKVCQNFIKDEHLKPFNVNTVFSVKENQRGLHEITFGSECDDHISELIMQGHEEVVTTIRENCLSFYVTAAQEIQKRLPINNLFLSKLKVFRPFESLFSSDRETSFNDVHFIAKTIGGFDGNALYKEWIALPSDLTMEEKRNLSTKTFDEMWKEILLRQHSDDIEKYPTLKSLLNAVRSLPNSNADSERMFSLQI